MPNRQTTRRKARPTQRRRRSGVRARSNRYWSQHVNETSNAMDLEKGVFNLRSPAQIARSVKRSAERSNRRKSEPFRSALSMLTFYVNRAGRNLTKARKKVLMRAKDELRRMYGR
jgi:hypothetical protein